MRLPDGDPGGVESGIRLASLHEWSETVPLSVPTASSSRGGAKDDGADSAAADDTELVVPLLNASAVTLESKSRLPQMLLESKAVAEKSMLRPGLALGDVAPDADADEEDEEEVRTCSAAACSTGLLWLIPR